MGTLICTTAVCVQLANGFTMQAEPPTEPPIVMAAYHVAEPNYTFKVPCKDGRLACEKRWSEDWPNAHATLPPITVTKPKEAHKKGKVVLSKSGVGNAGKSTSTEPSKPIPAQIAEQLARQGILYGAQTKAAALGFAAGGPGGALLASWGVCIPIKYGFIYQDWAKKERWDLHPEKAQGNMLYSVKMCSPFAFFFRFQEETEPHRKMFALLGVLAHSSEAYSNLAGQIAPAVPAMLDNLKLVGSGFNFSTTTGKTWFGQQRAPYHNGERWAADNP